MGTLFHFPLMLRRTVPKHALIRSHRCPGSLRALGGVEARFHVTWRSSFLSCDVAHTDRKISSPSAPLCMGPQPKQSTPVQRTWTALLMQHGAVLYNIGLL